MYSSSYFGTNAPAHEIRHGRVHSEFQAEWHKELRGEPSYPP